MLKPKLSASITLLTLFFLAVGCASTKNAKIVIPNYIGTWNYTIETPQGVQNGFFSFTETEEAVTGSIGSEAGTALLENFAITEETVSGMFYYEGYEVEVKGGFTENVLEGTMNAAGYEFPFKAVKE